MRPMIARATTQAAMLALLASSPAHAQVRPIPDPAKPTVSPGLPQIQAPTGPITPPTAPTGPLKIVKRPALLVSVNPVNVANDRKPVTMRVTLTGLGDAVSAHLYSFDPGCDFMRTPSPLAFNVTAQRTEQEALRVRGGAFQPTGGVIRSRYTTDYPNGQAQRPARPGLPVVDGVASFQMRGMISGSGDLRFEEQLGAAPDLAKAQMPDGILATYGAATTRPSGVQICTPRAYVTVTKADGSIHGLQPDGSLTDIATEGLGQQFTGNDWRVMPGRTVRYERSADLKTLLAPTSAGYRPGSVCEGTSWAVGGREYPVGVVTIDGDIGWRIRSGPVGTYCYAQLGGFAIPDGVGVRVSFSIVKDGTKCNITELPYRNTSGSGGPSGFTLNRTEQMFPLGRGFGGPGAFDLDVHAWLPLYQFPDAQSRFDFSSGMRKAGAALFCDGTLINDHGIELRLDWVELYIPDGVTFP